MPRPVPLSAFIARGIKAERARLGLTQDQLAERMGGWTGDRVYDVENGRRQLLADDLVALCRALHATVPELAKGADPADLRALGF